METLRGQVESLRLVREGWGTLVVLFGSANERASVTGHPLGVDPGDTVEVDGTWTMHPRFGRQFKAREIRVVAPSNAAGVIEWMRSRLPHVGRKLATAIVERFGLEDVWHVLELEHERLCEVAGITPERALTIHEGYLEHIHERDRMVLLKRWGLSDRQIARVLATWGEDALQEMRRDPYQLAELVDGFGFVRADDVARRMGLPANHPSRIQAALEHLLAEARGAGHCYVPAAKLIAMAARLLGVPEDSILREGRAAIAAGRLVQREASEGATRVYAVELDHAEQAVADAVRRLAQSERVAERHDAA